MTASRHTLLLIALLLAGAALRPARAQQAPVPAAAASTRADTTDTLLRPRSALFRSLLIPGWGQASVGAYKRGGLFFAAQSGSWYMLLKTMARLAEAHDIHERRTEFVADTLRARMAIDPVLAQQLADPVKFQERVDTSAWVRESQKVIDARKQQRQDWITYTLFFTFASGVDAFVAAQLADFPATIVTRPAPSGGLQLQLNVPVQRKP